MVNNPPGVPMKMPLLVLVALLLPIQSAESQADRLHDPVGNRQESSFPAPVDLRGAEFLVPAFSSDSIPSAGITVLENALGDVVHDGIVNLLDLLRLRDITIGRPPTPTTYELAEADLNVDGNVGAADLEVLRDILLRKKGVPHLLDSTGGSVLGGGITLTLPPGAVEEPVVISVQRQSESEFATEMGVDTKAAAADQAYFMASFEITSSTPDFKLPLGATIRLDSMPPCAYEGLNGLFAAVPDRDGDGRSELFLINELYVSNDSLTLTAEDIQVPNIESLSTSALEPGQSLLITGRGFSEDPQSIVVRFVSMANADSFQNLSPQMMDDSTIVVVAPGYPVGQCHVVLHDLRSGLTSNSKQVQILPPATVSGDIRSIIVNFYVGLALSMDSVDIYSIYSSLEDTTNRQHFLGLTLDLRGSIDNSIQFFNAYPDSLMSELQPIAAFIQSLGQGANPRSHPSRLQALGESDCPVCDPFLKQLKNLDIQYISAIKQYNHWAALCAVRRSYLCSPCEQAERYRQEVLNTTDVIATIRTLQLDCWCRNCAQSLGGICDQCKKTVFVGYGPQGQKISGGFSNGGWGTTGCCTNIKKYQSNQCISVPEYMNGTAGSPVPQAPPDELKCPPTGTASAQMSAITLTNTRPRPGSIIKVTNAAVPYNIVGVLNDNGKAFIPHVPMNTRVTFSMYDPVTGFYDPDVGSYTTGSTPGGFDRPILLFQPSTQIRSYSLRIGEPEHDSVSLDLQRIDYLLTVGAGDTSSLFNIGFSAGARLSLKIEDPQGNLLFDNADVACYSVAHVRFRGAGIYRIRVALGVGGQPASFDLGVSNSPNPPLASSCLCGTLMVDTLFSELSPYTVKCLAEIPANDTLTTEAGVILQFEPGGAVKALGTLKGVGSSNKPITLKHVGAIRQGLANNKSQAAHRKEVQP